MSDTTDKWRLSPCPFCGETMKLSMREFPEDNYVQCGTCTTTGPNGFDVECAVIQWNKRDCECGTIKFDMVPDFNLSETPGKWPVKSVSREELEKLYPPK